MSRAYEFSTFLDDDDVLSMKCSHQPNAAVIKFNIGNYPGPMITVFGNESDKERFTRAAAAFNAAMVDEPKPAIDPMFRALCESDGDHAAYVRAAE